MFSDVHKHEKLIGNTMFLALNLDFQFHTPKISHSFFSIVSDEDMQN